MQRRTRHAAPAVANVAPRPCIATAQPREQRRSLVWPLECFGGPHQQAARCRCRSAPAPGAGFQCRGRPHWDCAARGIPREGQEDPAVPRRPIHGAALPAGSTQLFLSGLRTCQQGAAVWLVTRMVTRTRLSAAAAVSRVSGLPAARRHRRPAVWLWPGRGAAAAALPAPRCAAVQPRRLRPSLPGRDRVPAVAVGAGQLRARARPAGARRGGAPRRGLRAALGAAAGRGRAAGCAGGRGAARGAPGASHRPRPRGRGHRVARHAGAAGARGTVRRSRASYSGQAAMHAE